MKIAVLTGGTSLERDISLRSGDAVKSAIDTLGYASQIFDIAEDFLPNLRAYEPDVAFCALHGGMGEDGRLQGALEVCGIPYTHSGVLATALAMDKDKSKAVMRAANIPVPVGVIASRSQIEAKHVMNVPYVVKPNNDGSSLGGLYLVNDLQGPPPVIQESTHNTFLVEEFIPGIELAASVLGDRGLAITQFDIEGLYDFEQKYGQTESNHILPAQIPSDIEKRVLELACEAHNALGCRGLSRADFRWDPSRGQDGIYVLEVNSQPGLRPNSNSGEQAALCGISFPELCDWIIKDASVNR